MKAVVILADSLNRRFLSAYGNEWVITPNIDRLQKKCAVFENHWVGSAPCMPARRDILTGRLNFLERNWGPIEPFDHTLPAVLRGNGIFSHMLTDHYHYLEVGGENYCQVFDTWECFRGQERDPWISRVKHPEKYEHYGKYSSQYELNRLKFIKEEDYPTPKTLKAAAEWLEDNREADNYLLFTEVFDPHEPFDVPREYLDLYNDIYNGITHFWPDYGVVNVPEESVEHIRKRYAALVTMTDHWIGKLLDVMDKYDMWKDTLVIFTTDHGYMTGEHNFMGKNVMPAYNEIFHIPLMVHYPGMNGVGQRINALTQNIDIMPTVMDFFSIDKSKCINKLHGKSWKPLLDGSCNAIRESLIYGYYGKNVNITDGSFTYFRTSVNNNNSPLNIYTAMPTTMNEYYGQDSIIDFNRIEMGRYLRWTDYPVYKLPADNLNVSNKTLAFDTVGKYLENNMLFDVSKDYLQNHPIRDISVEKKCIEMLWSAMEDHDSPEEQFIRLGR